MAMTDEAREWAQQADWYEALAAAALRDGLACCEAERLELAEARRRHEDATRELGERLADVDLAREQAQAAARLLARAVLRDDASAEDVARGLLHDPEATGSAVRVPDVGPPVWDGWHVKLLAWAVAESIQSRPPGDAGTGPLNYLQFTVVCADLTIDVLFQRRGGETPADVAKALKAERDALRVERDAARALATERGLYAAERKSELATLRAERDALARGAALPETVRRELARPAEPVHAAVGALLADLARVAAERDALAALRVFLPECWREGCDAPATTLERTLVRGNEYACDAHATGQYAAEPWADAARAPGGAAEPADGWVWDSGYRTLPDGRCARVTRTATGCDWELWSADGAVRDDGGREPALPAVWPAVLAAAERAPATAASAVVWTASTYDATMPDGREAMVQRYGESWEWAVYGRDRLEVIDVYPQEASGRAPTAAAAQAAAVAAAAQPAPRPGLWSKRAHAAGCGFGLMGSGECTCEAAGGGQ